MRFKVINSRNSNPMINPNHHIRVEICSPIVYFGEYGGTLCLTFSFEFFGEQTNEREAFNAFEFLSEESNSKSPDLVS